MTGKQHKQQRAPNSSHTGKSSKEAARTAQTTTTKVAQTVQTAKQQQRHEGPESGAPRSLCALGLSCETVVAPPDRAAGARTRQPENSKRAHLRVPALQTPPKFNEKTPRETRKNEISGGREKKKREILGGPAEGGPGERPKNLEHTHHTHKQQQQQPGTNKHQQAPSDTNRHQQVPTGNNRKQQETTGNTQEQPRTTTTTTENLAKTLKHPNWPNAVLAKCGLAKCGHDRGFTTKPNPGSVQPLGSRTFCWSRDPFAHWQDMYVESRRNTTSRSGRIGGRLVGP